MLPGPEIEENQWQWEERGALLCHPVEAAEELLFSPHPFVLDKPQINHEGPGKTVWIQKLLMGRLYGILRA